MNICVTGIGNCGRFVTDALDILESLLAPKMCFALGRAALIAGNPPERRTERLHAFWDLVSSGGSAMPFLADVMPRGLFNEMSASSTMMQGVPGFFAPRIPPATLMPKGSVGASSFYDTAPLRDTLLDLVDIDYLNAGPVRLSTAAVNIETGNITWFDSAKPAITVEHIMASGALPPGFPAIEIDGQFYWDGGLVSNTPLKYVYDERPDEALCIFQVDPFRARGKVPASIWDVEARTKDIRFSSRTRLNTDLLRKLDLTREAGRRLHDKLPPELREDPDARALLSNDRAPASPSRT